MSVCTPGLVEQLNTAMENQRAGRYTDAERIYRQVLAQERDQPDALHLLGLLSCQTGRTHESVGLIRRAISVRPRIAPFHSNLGNALLSLGLLAEAIESFERALGIDPRSLEAHLNLGNALQQQGKLADAVAHYRIALRHRPDCPEAHNNLGNALAAMGRAMEAQAALGQALRLRPNYAEAHANLGRLLMDETGCLEQAAACYQNAARHKPELAEAHAGLGAVRVRQERFAEAEVACHEALRLRPAYPEALLNLGRALDCQRRWAGAERAARAALELRPEFPEAFNNLGNALQQQGHIESALENYREALRLRPQYAGAHYNMGNALRASRRPAEAVAAYSRALEIKPDEADIHWNRALTRLWMGDFENGWDEYEWRWRRKQTPPRALDAPMWDGAPLGGRTILLHAEQGLGDTIQFARYAALVRDRGGRVVLECPAEMVRLLAGLDGVEQIVGAGQPLPQFSVHAPLLSLPRIFGTRTETIPSAESYLKVPAPASPVHASTVGRKRIGLAWAGNPQHPADGRRSCGLAALTELIRTAERAGWGVEWVSLHKEPSPQAAANGIGWVDEAATLEGLASLILGLDLVITVDSAPAHLAGALGREVWTLLASECDWRWGLEGETTPWYPAMRLVRQSKPGDWSSAIQETVARLGNFFKSPNH
ncbi:MAG: tetratricopeptide repeat protein [Candidatus Acidiferrales bacterium]